MNPLSKTELEDVFVDVRKAYRLLYFYQRRIMDTAGFIASILSQHIQSGYALHSSNAPKNGSNLNIDRWAWDWLNMYSYEFYLGSNTKDGVKYEMAIAVQADSGFDDADEGVTGIDVEKFPPVETCVTKIYLYIGKNTWKPDEFEFTWYKDADDEYIYNEDGKLFIGKRFDLSDFSDEAKIREKVNQFKEFVKSKGITELW